MTIRRCTFILVVLAAVAAPAFAQDEPVTFAFGPAHQAGIGVVAVEPFDGGRPVTGAPYSAVAVTDVTQTLADGNRIEHRTVVGVFRDSEGRVRREQPSLPLGGLIAQPGTPIVTITDPVSGAHVMLDRERKAAFRTVVPGDMTFEQPIAVGGAVGVAGIRGGIARAEAVAPPNVRTERLGEQQIEGVRAEGTRTTMTIPAGSVGNQLPIEVVSERWYSPELQVVVMTRRADPRFGETVYRLTEIVRAEPPAELFQVPADFTTDAPRATPGIRVR
jgi:hypothetical protein